MNTFCLHLQALALICLTMCLPRTIAFDTKGIKTAENITWSSTNFKTLLEWKPKPENYTYTVEVSGKFSNWKKRCIGTKETECDITSLLQDVKDTYTARIFSVVPVPEDVIEEFPYSGSPSFIPYEQTILGKTVIDKFELSKENGKLHVVIKDSVTPYRFADGSFKTMGDIFGQDISYTVYYRRASSTGRKQASSVNKEIVINVDKGENYCIYAQITIPSRKVNRNSQESDEKCTPEGSSGFDLNILVAVISAVVLIVVIIILSVIICKCRKAKVEKSKETTPLREA